MPADRTELNRLDVLRALKISNWEAVASTVHGTLTGGAFQTGFALWLGANNFWMGILAAIPTFSSLVQLVSSYFVERRGERRLFTAWFSGAARFLWLPILLVPFLLPPGARFFAFVGLFLLSSILIQVPAPAFLSWISDLVPPDNRGRYFGRRNMLAGITTMVVSLPAAWFLDLAVKRHLFSEALGFGALFGFAVLCGLVSFLLLLRQPEPMMRRPEGEELPGLAGLLAFYRAPFAEANFRRLMLFNVMFAAAQFFAAPFYTVYALQVLQLNYVWLQVFATLSSLTSLLTMPLWGYLGDKYGNKPLLGIAVFGVGILPLLWVATSPAHMTYSLIVICVNNLLGGLFWAGVGLTQFNLLIGVTPTERRSVYVGAMSAMTGIAGGLSPVVGGAILTGMHGATISPLGWEMDSYRILFAINAAMRYITLLALRPVVDAGATTARDVLSQLGSSGVGSWVQIRRLQRAPSESGRRQAAQALRNTRAALAVEELIAALDDPSLQVREEAAEALGEIGDARAVKALIARLDDNASGIVDEAAQSLGRIGDRRAVAPLVKLLKAGERIDRVAAARALGHLGGDAAVKALLETVESADEGKSGQVVEACVSALGHIGDPSATDALIRCLSAPSRALRVSAIRALGDIGDPRAAGPLLAQLASEEDSSVISYIAVSLAMIDATYAVRPLLESLDRVSSPIARKQMLNAVGALMGDGEAFYPLLALEGMARDEAVTRQLREMARRERMAGQKEFSRRRRARQIERALEEYMAGRGDAAALLLARLAPPGKKDRAATPAGHALYWAVDAAQHRELNQDEFLLVLFAVRRLLE